jgi:hypothetical protein
MENNNDKITDSLLSILADFRPRVTKFPSGSLMIDILIRDVPYTVEYDAGSREYGLSLTKNATYGWEGFEEIFPNMDSLKGKIFQIGSRS